MNTQLHSKQDTDNHFLFIAVKLKTGNVAKKLHDLRDALFTVYLNNTLPKDTYEEALSSALNTELVKCEVVELLTQEGCLEYLKWLKKHVEMSFGTLTFGDVVINEIDDKINCIIDDLNYRDAEIQQL